MSASLLQTKSLDALTREAEQPEYRLRRALGPFHLTLLGIGAIIGAGIFATIGTAAAGDPVRPGAGPALMLSFVCKVEKTECPVWAARTAISAVSRSRISPTITMSGSWRRIERNPLANVMPISGLTWT